MKLINESTKTNAGTRKLPMTEDVFRCFQAIIEDREKPRYEKMVDGYTGFLFTDKDGLPLADARKELEKVKGENPVSQKMFRAI